MAPRIFSRQFFLIILGLSLGLELIRIPPILIRAARQGLWLSMIVGTTGDLLVATMLYLLGRAATLLYSFFFLHTAAIAGYWGQPRAGVGGPRGRSAGRPGRAQRTLYTAAVFSSD